MLRQIGSLYSIADAAGVSQYLSARPEVAQALVTVAEKAPEYFPQSSERRLRIVAAYEDEPECALVQIVTPLPAREALEQLKRLDSEWWLAASTSPGFDALVVDVLPLVREG
jgi:hypothetical protein